MIELKPGLPASSVLQQIVERKQSLANSGSAMDWEQGQRYYLTGVEALEGFFTHQFIDSSWLDRLYSSGYWAVREMNSATTRPMPLLTAESNRLIRWLDEIEVEMKRIASEDEWDEVNTPRVVLDTSALVRDGEFDRFDWAAHVGTAAVRLVIPILVVRELDDLKNFGKSNKARPRLRRLRELLEGSGRGPARVSDTVTVELLMDPKGHVRLSSHDEEIVRRASYLAGRRGGPLRIVTGDYTMLFTAQAADLSAELTPAELRLRTDSD